MVESQKYLNCYNIGSLLSSLVRGGKTGRKEVKIINTKYNFLFLVFLYKKGYIWSFRKDISGQNLFWVTLKYWRGDTLIKDFSLVSKPSKRIYWNLTQMKRILNKENRTVYILSTNLGIKTHLECLQMGVGGEVICKLM